MAPSDTRVANLQEFVRKLNAPPVHLMLARVGLAPASLRSACETMMKSSGEKHSRGSPDSPTEKEAKQPKPCGSPEERPSNAENEEREPTEREIKAALAARERLYGDKTQQKDSEADIPRLPTGPEPTAAIEVEYPSSDSLQPVEEPSERVVEALKGMADSDWRVTTPALVVLRRLTLHHRHEVWHHISEIMPLILKSLKSLRSSLSKTAIMSAADVIRIFKDRVEPHLNKGGASKPAASLLYQLLLKGSSNDKRFVVDEAKATLDVLADSISPTTLLDHILPYAEHKSPKIRGAASGVLLACTRNLKPEDWKVIGIEQLLKVAGKLVSDNTPDARNAAKQLLLLLRSTHASQVGEKENANADKPSHAADQPAKQVSEPGDGQKEAAVLACTWEAQCQKCLGATRAIAVLKVVGTDE